MQKPSSDMQPWYERWRGQIVGTAALVIAATALVKASEDMWKTIAPWLVVFAPRSGPVLNSACAVDNAGRKISLSRGQSATWPCPSMAPGKYTATFSVGGDTPQGASRVTYSVHIRTASGQIIPLTSRECADIHIDPKDWKPALCPSALVANGDNITIPQGDVDFVVVVSGVAGQNDFRNQNFGSFDLDKTVNIGLQRAN